MAMTPPGSSYVPSARAIEILQERLQRMGFMLSEPAARSLLEAVLALEIPRFEIQTRATAQSSLEQIRQAAQAALLALARSPAEPVAPAPRPMSPPIDAREAVRARVAVEPEPAVRQPRPVEPPRIEPRPMVTRRPDDEPQVNPPRVEPRPRPRPDDDEPRPVFKRPRGR
jgi:hypothetical protein